MAGPEVHAQTLCIGKLVQRTMTAPSCNLMFEPNKFTVPESKRYFV